MQEKELYRIITWDVEHKHDLHWFEANNHQSAIEYAADHIKSSERKIWSAKVLTMDGRLISLDGELIEEEKIIAENERFVKEELGIYQLELGKEAYNLFNSLYELSKNDNKLLAALILLQNKFKKQN